MCQLKVLTYFKITFCSNLYHKCKPFVVRHKRSNVGIFRELKNIGKWMIESERHFFLLGMSDMCGANDRERKLL
jgi:hypothetical protein